MRVTGGMVAYGERIAVVLLNSGLADEIVVVTLPKVAGSDEKALRYITGDGAAWMVRSCKVLDDEKVRTVYGRVCVAYFQISSFSQPAGKPIARTSIEG